MLVCYDVEFPETVRAAAQAGAELVVVPTALGAEWDQVARRVVPARAFENGVYLAYANYAGSERGFTYLGESRIVRPDGRDMAVAGDGEECIEAIIDRDAMVKIRRRLPYLRDCRGLILE